MELPHRTDLLPAPESGPTIDADCVVSVVLLRGGGPETVLLRLPARDGSNADGRAGITPAETSGDALIAKLVEALTGTTPRIALSQRQRPPVVPRDADIPAPISDAETRVLRFLPTNMPAWEIAAELSVSVNTVKTHIHHIYAKLDVHRRGDAVERARELGLLPTPSLRTVHR